DGDVDEEGPPRHREPPAHDLAVLDLAERIGHLDELVPRARDPEALLLEQVLPIHEDRRRRGMADAVCPAVPPAEVTERVDEVVPGGRVREAVDRPAEPLTRERTPRSRPGV